MIKFIEKYLILEIIFGSIILFVACISIFNLYASVSGINKKRAEEFAEEYLLKNDIKHQEINCRNDGFCAILYNENVIKINCPTFTNGEFECKGI